MLDILIIGSGGAGLTTAIEAKEQGAKVLVISKNLPTQAQTAMAQGGINASLDKDDSPQKHIDDTLRSAHNLADEEMVTKLCQEAPKTVKWLDQKLIPFSRKANFNPKDPLSSLAQRRMGGASYPRTCYAQDYTGLKILQTLYDRALELGVEFISRYFLLDLIVQDSEVLGAEFWDISKGEVRSIYAKATIIATGGFAGIYYGFSTNAYGATGDGIATVLRAGGVVEDMEFIQFHPTAMYPSSTLLSEGARGAGALLINDKGERFVDELAPRDVVSRAIFEQISNKRKVFLDLRPIPKSTLLELMPQELHLAKLHANIDPLKEPIPIQPASHYTMGGIAVDRDLRIKGLKRAYSVGECSSARVHGANRLGGNSLLEVITFAKLCATKALREPKLSNSSYQNSLAKEKIEKVLLRPSKINHYYKQRIIGERLYSDLGIVREKEQLQSLLDEIDKLSSKLEQTGLKDHSLIYNQELIELLEYENTLLLAKVATRGAILRQESRGSHYRKDFPKESKEWQKHIQIRVEDGELIDEIDD